MLEQMLALGAYSFALAEYTDNRTVAYAPLFLHPRDEFFCITAGAELLSVDFDQSVGVDRSSVPILLGESSKSLH